MWLCIPQGCFTPWLPRHLGYGMIAAASWKQDYRIWILMDWSLGEVEVSVCLNSFYGLISCALPEQLFKRECHKISFMTSQRRFGYCRKAPSHYLSQCWDNNRLLSQPVLTAIWRHWHSRFNGNKTFQNANREQNHLGILYTGTWTIVYHFNKAFSERFI